VAYIAASKYDVTTTESRSYTSIRSNMGWMSEYWYDTHKHETVQSLAFKIY
jgi:hypothetical protein